MISGGWDCFIYIEPPIKKRDDMSHYSDIFSTIKYVPMLCPPLSAKIKVSREGWPIDKYLVINDNGDIVAENGSKFCPELDEVSSNDWYVIEHELGFEEAVNSICKSTACSVAIKRKASTALYDISSTGTLNGTPALTCEDYLARDWQLYFRR
jgi:hypothetical protein